jgi:hypothetical protein
MKNLRRIAQFLLTILTLLVIAFAWDNVDGFAGNLLATLLGVGIGLPAALYIDRQITTRRDENETQRRTDQTLSQLEFLMKELEQADKDLCARRDTNSVILPPINTQLWQVLHTSKRLREVKDLSLLAKIGDAYNRISAHQQLEMQVHSLIKFAGSGHEHDPEKHILTDLRNMDTDTLASIATAVKSIKRYLKQAAD